MVSQWRSIIGTHWNTTGHWKTTGSTLETHCLPTILSPGAFQCTLGSKSQAHWIASGLPLEYHWLSVREPEAFNVRGRSWVTANSCNQKRRTQPTTTTTQPFILGHLMTGSRNGIKTTISRFFWAFIFIHNWQLVTSYQLQLAFKKSLQVTLQYRVENLYTCAIIRNKVYRTVTYMYPCVYHAACACNM